MVDALWVGGSRADTDFHALSYQLRLLGFNAVRLPFTFSDLKRPGRGQAMACTHNGKAAWARRATDPDLRAQPEYFLAPDPAVEVPLEGWERELCNTYVPGNDTALTGERLLWAVEYFVASGFYVVVGPVSPTASLTAGALFPARACLGCRDSFWGRDPGPHACRACGPVEG
jgi:hypothetical protein